MRITVDLIASGDRRAPSRAAGQARGRGALVYSGRGAGSGRGTPTAKASYIVRGLPPGKYYSQRRPQAHRSLWRGAPDVTVAAGEQRTNVNIELQHGGTIAGTIVEANGAPASSLFSALRGAASQIDCGDDVTAPRRQLPRGHAHRRRRLQALGSPGPALEPALRGRPWPASDGPCRRVGDPRQRRAASSSKRAHQRIAGTVMRGRGPAAARRPRQRLAHRQRRGADDALEREPQPPAITGADGSFTIGDLDGGAVTRSTRAAATAARATVENVAAGASGVVVALQASGGVDGTLVGFAAPPEVTARFANPFVASPPAWATVSGTTFQLRGLAPGNYVVYADGGGGLDSAAVRVDAGQIATVTLRDSRQRRRPRPRRRVALGRARRGAALRPPLRHRPPAHRDARRSRLQRRRRRLHHRRRGARPGRRHLRLVAQLLGRPRQRRRW